MYTGPSTEQRLTSFLCVSIEYCPRDDNDKEDIRLFYESLLEHSRKPSAFDIITNTKVLFSYTVKNVVEFMFVVDAFVLAAKKVFSVYNYRYWSWRALLSLYLTCYLGYTAAKSSTHIQ